MKNTSSPIVIVRDAEKLVKALQDEPNWLENFFEFLSKLKPETISDLISVSNKDKS